MSEHELIMTRAALDDLRDKLYMLEAAVDDVERDIGASSTKAEFKEALEWLLEWARPLRESVLDEGS